MHAAGRQPPAFGDAHPAVSPDGRWLVFEREFAPPSAELDLLPLGRNLTGGGEIRRLPIAVVNWDYTTWMPDSKEILFSSEGSLWRAAILGGHPPARVPFVGENGIMPAVSRPQPARPSRLVYVRAIDVGATGQPDAGNGGNGSGGNGGQRGGNEVNPWSETRS